MKRQLVLPAILILILSVVVSGCSGNKTEKKPVTEETPVASSAVPVVIGNETSVLLKDLAESGDYVNSKDYPSLIKASIVHENLGKNLHIIDLRPSSDFKSGHIKGAVNKRFEDLPSYFEKGIKPYEFEKIVIVCEDGQLSTYTTCLLRLMGYGNVFAMRWGMSAWNNSYAEKGWLSGISGKFESSLENTPHDRPVASAMPELNTGKATGEEIAFARFGKLFEEGSADIAVTAAEVFSDPSKYFIVNLDRKDKYEDGHIPGAYRYKPEATLGFTEEMASIPFNKTVVVYCGTGHNSASATAYLRLFGYDARTLKYGNNSFMHDKMIKQKVALSWLPFSKADVNDFEVVK
jgi:rhodanese-related sulfurtransferase